MDRRERRRVDALFGKRSADPIDHKLGIAFVVDMLELAATTSVRRWQRKVSAWWDHAMRPRLEPVVWPDDVARRRARKEPAPVAYPVPARG